jgi:hypothetical protein
MNILYIICLGHGFVASSHACLVEYKVGLPCMSARACMTGLAIGLLPPAMHV